MHRRLSSAPWFALVGALLTATLFTAGCQRSPRTGLISTMDDPRLTEAELEARTREIAGNLVSGVEQLSQRIVLETDDPILRRRAIQFMIWMNIETIRATSHDDPFASTFDLWALVLQSRDYFEADPELPYGAYRAEAFDVMERANLELVRLGEDTGSGSPRQWRPMLLQWVEENPIGHGNLWRPSTTPLLAQFTSVEGGNVFDAVDSLDESVSQIVNRLDVLTTQLPKQLVWHATLLIDDRLQDLNSEEIYARVDRALALAENLDASIDGRIDEALASVDGQRQDTLERVERLSDETIASIEIVRDQALADVDRLVDRVVTMVEEESAESLDMVRQTVTDATDAVRAIQVETFAEIDTVRVAAFQDGQVLADSTIDRLFTQGLKLLGAAFIAGALLIALHARLTRPQRVSSRAR